MNAGLSDPMRLHTEEIGALVRSAAAKGARVDAYFGGSRYYGAATPVGIRDGSPVVRFVWLGPAETKGERRFLVRDRPQLPPPALPAGAGGGA